MSDGEARATARRMWQLLETVHAVVYFAPEVAEASRQLGLKGFWMGYFAGRAAPLGPAPPEVVAATFFNFHPAMVARALPDAWSIACPGDVTAARLAAVDDALRRLLGSRDLAPAADLAADATRACSIAGRPLFAAHTALAWPESPTLRLWLAATLVREHRGDGHVAANVAHGFDGLAAHVMLCGTDAVPRSTIQPNRGWSDEEWDGTVRSLARAGLVDGDGRLTEAGRSARERVEETTDHLAAGPWAHLGAERTAALEDRLRPIAEAIAASGVIPFPNPMGLPRPSP